LIGETLYLTTGLINSDYLPGLIAHELGHTNSSDGRLVLATRRFVLPFSFVFTQLTGSVAPGLIMFSGSLVGSARVDYLASQIIMLINFMLAFFGGGFGLLLLNPLWVWYWRDREYKADLYAAECGMARNLIEYFEVHKYFDAAVPFFMSEHPYTELRIDRLLAFEEYSQLVIYCTECGGENKVTHSSCTSCAKPLEVPEKYKVG